VSARDGGDATVALASFLEASSLDDFLASAVLANREFTAMKESIMVLDQTDTGPTVVQYVEVSTDFRRIDLGVLIC
jgi:hypothetical protein